MGFKLFMINRNYFLFLFIAVTFSLLTACMAKNNNFAPVSDGWKDTQGTSSTYRVQAEETLYMIAFRFGLDYQTLAAINHLRPPYRLIPGQDLLLSDTKNLNYNDNDHTVVTGSAPLSPVTSQAVMPVKNLTQPNKTEILTAKITHENSTTAVSAPVSSWLWPADGKIIQQFTTNYGGNKGIDIAGKLNDPIKATATGKVVYCGTGLKSYGLLIIVKHNGEYLSAYAYNYKALVKEGDTVTRGQQIALMGQNDSKSALLHFEIRQKGKPVDPLTLLPKLKY